MRETLYIISDIEKENLQQLIQRLSDKGYQILNTHRNTALSDLTLCEKVLLLPGYDNNEHCRKLYSLALSLNKIFISRLQCYNKYSPIQHRIAATYRSIGRNRMEDVKLLFNNIE